MLFTKYIAYRSNPSLLDFDAQNKKDFQDKNGKEKISNYLTSNCIEIINRKSTEDRKMLIQGYPFNTISKAKETLKNYKENEPSFKFTTPE